ncbi:MAG: HK97 gp10 family phage protein [Nitrososphaerota archaeon]
MSVSYRVKIDGLEKLLNQLSPEKSKLIQDKILENTARVMAEEVANLSPVRTGQLMRSWSYRKISDSKYIVGSKAEYASFVEFGTRPHVIYPRRARALRFEVDGEVVFARRVHHPGTPAQKFVAQALRLVQNRFRQFANNIINEVMKK